MKKRSLVNQGHHAVSADPDEQFATVLGSCVACCAYDSVSGIGGMNHILLPGGKSARDDEERHYGVYLMEVMLNEMFGLGADRSRLRFKLFGGANLIGSRLDPGRANIEFVRQFLLNEAYSIVSESVGGQAGRRVLYHPTTGRAWVKPLAETRNALEAAKPAQPAPRAHAAAGEVEFF